MSDAQAMTTAIVVALHFGGNYEKARAMLNKPEYIPTMLGKCRFNRHRHRIKPMFLTLFTQLGEVFKALNSDSVYAIDTIPIAACDNIRIPRVRLYTSEVYRGAISRVRNVISMVLKYIC